MSTYLRQNSFKFVRQESFNELHNSLFLFIYWIPDCTILLHPPFISRSAVHFTVPDTSFYSNIAFTKNLGLVLRLKHSTDVNRCELKKTLSNVIIQRNFLHGHHIITDLSKPKKNKSSVRFFPNKVHTDGLSFSLLLAHKGGHMKHKFSFWSHS